ncbi:hypothetical protein IFVP22_C1280099 [Vibrio parahaemolyticus]
MRPFRSLMSQEHNLALSGGKSDTGQYCLRLFDLHQHLAVQTFK